MKKIPFVTRHASILLFFFSLNTNANIRDGLYAGAGIGSTDNHFGLTTTDYTTNQTFYNNANHTATVGNIFFGVGYTLVDSYFLGAEVGTNFPGRYITITNRPAPTFGYIPVNDKLKIYDYVTLDLLPGYAITQYILLYGRLGLVHEQLDLTQPAVGQIAPEFKTSKDKWGGRIGIGTNVAINETFGIGLDYIYSRYEHMNPMAALYNSQFTIKPSCSYLGISILYNVS